MDKQKLYNASKILFSMSKELFSYDEFISNILLSVSKKLVSDLQKSEQSSTSKTTRSVIQNTNLDIDEVERKLKQFVDELMEE